MGLFPQAFLDDLRCRPTSCRWCRRRCRCAASAAATSGSVPFHNEKTPSFSVNREQGFFHCFGCGVGGNVFKFVELHERLSFPEAVRVLAQKFGVAMPGEAATSNRDAAADGERENLIALHEVAAKFYREVLASDAGRRGRELLDRRGLRPADHRVARLRLRAAGARHAAVAPAAARACDPKLAVKAGLVVDRDGRLSDRFWNRLMIPICRESGLVVALRRAGDGSRPGPEVPEQPGDADLLEGPHALRPERDQEARSASRAGR